MAERIKKVQELIKTELGKIIFKEIEFPKGTLVTVTRVEVSRSFDHCKVFVSCFPEKKFKEVFKILNSQIFKLQKILDKKLVMRKVPKISFLKEKKILEAARIEEILERLKKEKK